MEEEPSITLESAINEIDHELLFKYLHSQEIDKLQSMKYV